MIRRAYSLAGTLCLMAACLFVPPATRGDLDIWARTGLVLWAAGVLVIFLIGRREAKT